MTKVEANLQKDKNSRCLCDEYFSVKHCQISIAKQRWISLAKPFRTSLLEGCTMYNVQCTMRIENVRFAMNNVQCAMKICNVQRTKIQQRL